MNRQKFKMALLLAVTWIIAGCATAPQIVMPSNPANPIKRVAILPMLDNSDDVDAPTRIRDEFFNRLGRYNYDIQPLAETNELLNFQMGITMGKQYDQATPQEIGKTLGVDGLFYGYLLDFDEVTTGFVNSYKVRMGWKLVDTKTGKVSWGKGVAVRRTQSIGNLAGAAHAVGSATDQVGLTESEKVEVMPGSKDPMNEMPGLDKWISMGDKSSSLAGGIVGGLMDKVGGGIMGNSLKNEIKFAYDNLFPTMLVGPVVK